MRQVRNMWCSQDKATEQFEVVEQNQHEIKWRCSHCGYILIENKKPLKKAAKVVLDHVKDDFWFFLAAFGLFIAFAAWRKGMMGQWR